MTKYNSSRYRVEPLVDAIKSNDDNLNKMLATVESSFLIPAFNSLEQAPVYYYGENEKPLKPSKEHLIKLVEYFASKKFDHEISGEERRDLLGYNGEDKRLEAKTRALAKIENVYGRENLPIAWYIFEGSSYPDLFIEGKDVIIICEGKWTEPYITTETTHLKTQRGEYRNQMVRHIQGALNYSQKKVIAFYIVDEDCGYLTELEKAAFDEQLSKETITLSAEETCKISSAFYGYTTWQRLSKAIPELKFLSKEEIDQIAKK